MSIREAIKSTMNTLTGKAPKMQTAEERRAAHEARKQEQHTKKAHAQQQATLARATAQTAHDQALAAIEADRHAAVMAERERISELFGSRQEKMALQEESSQRIEGAAEEKRSTAKKELAEQLASIEAKASPVARECDRCLVELEATQARTEREITEKLLADFHDSAPALLERWIEAPTKRNAEPIGRLFWDLHLRCKKELGGELMPDLIGIAFADVIGKDSPDAVAGRLGGDWGHPHPVLHACQAFVRSLEEGVAEIAKALHVLQEAVEEVVARAKDKPEERTVRRYAEKRRAATYGQQAELLQTFDKEEKRKDLEAFKASHRSVENVRLTGDGSEITYKDGGVEHVSAENAPGGRRVMVIKQAGGAA